MNDKRFNRLSLVTALFLLLAGTLWAQENTGDVWLVAPLVVKAGDSFYVEVHLNTGDQALTAYGIVISYNTNLVYQYYDIEAVSPYGFFSIGGLMPQSGYNITGFDTIGKGPDTDMHLLNIHLKAVNQGTCNFSLTVKSLVDVSITDIGTPRGIGTSTTIGSEWVIGDVNMSGTVDIVDALIVAQYYTNVQKKFQLNPDTADVNRSGTIDIIDALIIAQYSVGIVSQLPL